MIEQPAILVRQRTEEAKQLRKVNGDVGVKFSGSKEYTVRQDNMSNTITTVEKDNLLIEPTIQRVGNIYPSKGQGGQVVRSEGIAPAVCECHGEVTRVVEPKIVGYTRDCKGKVVGHHFKSESNTLNCGGGSTEQYVAEPRIVSIGNRNPSGHGIGGEVYDCERLSPTLCVNKGSDYTISEPLNILPLTPIKNQTKQPLKPTLKEMKPKPQYRIRKLTPRECFRLMDVDDACIDKILQAGISKSQCYKLAGNSIVVNCMFHIFKNLFSDVTPSNRQLTLF